MNKKELRKYCKNIISSIDSNSIQASTELVMKNLTSLFSKNSIGIIGLYWPLKDELNLCSFDWSGFTLSVAQIDDHKMEYKKISLSDYKARHDYKSTWETKTVIPDALLIPGLGFDKRGYRLGRGGGYFDRYLQSYNGLKVGICLEDVILKQIPNEAHDIKMDYIITNKNIYKED